MSITYTGIIVTLLATFLPKLGIDVGTDQLTMTISTLATIGGALLALWGRYRLGGITVLGSRK